MIEVLIVDDSVTSRLALRYIIDQSGDMTVVGEARTGREAISLAQRLNPKLILMDMMMPEMDGLEATGEIMHSNPVPIVIVSAGLQGREAEVTFQAIQKGALTVVPKPPGPLDPDYARNITTFLQTLRAMSQVHVIHHKKSLQPKPVMAVVQPTVYNGTAQITAIVSSTGGPAALSEIFKRLPSNYPIPIVAVQHISHEFLPSLVHWLDSVTQFRVQIARRGQKPEPGTIYFAPGNVNLVFSVEKTFDFNEDRQSAHMPSGNALLNSVAARFGRDAIGVILTGMGEDGVEGLSSMYARGAYTIAQDEATSVVFGMPQAAIQRRVVRSVLPVNEISDMLLSIVK